MLGDSALTKRMRRPVRERIWCPICSERVSEPAEPTEKRDPSGAIALSTIPAAANFGNACIYKPEPIECPCTTCS
jgi:hypothetical protein